MPESLDKAQELEKMQAGYNAFEALLAPLIETQMTAPDVNDGWSVKDNLAHLSAWHKRVIQLLNATMQGIPLPDPTPDMTTDEVNAQFYQENRGRSLQDVHAEFRVTYQQVCDAVQAISTEDLNKPLDWLDGRSVGEYIPVNTYEHYQEHTDIIEAWLKRQ
jgi:hypothetical protein